MKDMLAFQGELSNTMERKTRRTPDKEVYLLNYGLMVGGIYPCPQIVDALVLLVYRCTVDPVRPDVCPAICGGCLPI